MPVWRRVAAAWVTIDESTAVALAQSNDRAARVGFWVTGVVIFVGWNLTTLAGALIGDALGDTRPGGWMPLPRPRSSGCSGPD